VIQWQLLQQRADPYLSDIERLSFRHQILRIEAEIAWHDELLEHLSN
jgi:hypothetical protein